MHDCPDVHNKHRKPTRNTMYSIYKVLLTFGEKLVDKAADDAFWGEREEGLWIVGKLNWR